MQFQIKKTIKAGNSSAVILPRAWLNREVRVELMKKPSEQVLCEVLAILNKNITLTSIIGVYLVGSYARGEEEEDSDMDILVITNNIDKGMINEGIYNILIVSEELLAQKLTRDLFPIGQMIYEAKPLLNSNYLSLIKIKVTKENVKWYLDTTEEKLKIIKEYFCKSEKRNYLSDRIAYTLILRIRTLEIIKKLIQNKQYSKIDFIDKINKISGNKNSYERYLSVKNNLKEQNKLKKDQAEKLCNYLEKDLEKVKKILGRR